MPVPSLSKHSFPMKAALPLEKEMTKWPQTGDVWCFCAQNSGDVCLIREVVCRAFGYGKQPLFYCFFVSGDLATYIEK